MNKEIYEKITLKKQFSQLPKKDVELAFRHFEKRQVSDEEKIRLTRELLHKVFGAFSSEKLLSLKNKDEEWILKKHMSTRERLPYYKEIYQRILKNSTGEITIFDLGAGVNGFSYKFMEKVLREKEKLHSQVREIDLIINNKKSRAKNERATSRMLIHKWMSGVGSRGELSEKKQSKFASNNIKVNYIGIEAIGQLVELTNYYFKTRGIENCSVLHMSLFELDKIKKYIKQTQGEKIVFLFKTLDSLEMLEKNYSKKLLLELKNSVDKIVVSFATRSLVKRQKFRANRNWILKFIKESFKVSDDFEVGGEKYVVFIN